MPTLQGTDGDTTGALITNITTSTELTALVQPASGTDSGAETPAQFDKLAALGVGTIANATTADGPTSATVFTAALNVATNTLKGLLSASDFDKLDHLHEYTHGADLPNADITIAPSTDQATIYMLPVATLTADHIVTLDDSAGVSTQVAEVLRLDRTAHTYTIKNTTGDTLYVSGATPTADIVYTLYHNGTKWVANSISYVSNA